VDPLIEIEHDAEREHERGHVWKVAQAAGVAGTSCVLPDQVVL